MPDMIYPATSRKG